MSATETGGSRRRRRRSGSMRPAGGLPAYLKGTSFARHLACLMIAIAIAYCGSILWRTREATFFFNNVTIGMTKSEIRYMLGTPRSTGAADRAWLYDDGGRTMHIGFDETGRMDAINCLAAGQARFACPEVLGLRVGDSEDKVWLKLGAPSRQIYRGNDKTIHYDGMGLVFYLTRYTVTGIEVRKGGNLMGYAPRALWGMLP